MDDNPDYFDESLWVPLDGVHWEDPSQDDTYRAARAYVDAGFSLIPISADGTKMPAFDQLPGVWDEKLGRWKHPWSPYRNRHPSDEELRAWFLEGYLPLGMAILCGKISGGLEIIDLDNDFIAAQWQFCVHDANPDLFFHLVQVQSPRPGVHVYYRCEESGGNKKLAMAPETNAETGEVRPKTLIEVKGEGGYCLAPPSPPWCHPKELPYRFIDATNLTRTPTILPEERELLFEVARSFNEWEAPKKAYSPRVILPKSVTPTPPHGTPDTSRPGDDFNARSTWEEILEPHGWACSRASDGVEYWTRPGKANGPSASTNYADSDLLYVFSTNAGPLESERAYTKFAAYALLNCNGDFGEAARQLARAGFGQRPAMRGRQKGARKQKPSALQQLRRGIRR